MKLFLESISIVLVILLSGCDQTPECNQSTLSGVKFNFVKNTHFEEIEVSDSIFNEDSVFINVVVRDTTVAISRPSSPVWFHSAGSSSDTVYSSDWDSYQVLPLTAGLTSHSFYMNYGDESDEIQFFYDETLTFLDIPCGFIANFNIDSFRYTSTMIDSIQFLSPDADNDVSTENIIIYYY